MKGYIVMHTIKIDDKVWKYLKKYAEPLEDTPNSVISRLLNKRAHQIDALFSEPGYIGFKALLKDKYSQHGNIIDIFFDTLGCDHPPPENQEEEFRLLKMDL